MAGMESIYSLIPQPVPPVIKPERYHSKHPGNKPPTFSTFGLTGTSKPGYQNVAGAESSLKEGHHVFQKGHATMGKEGNARKPSDILKKGTGGGGGAADLAGASTGGGKLLLGSWTSVVQHPMGTRARLLPTLLRLLRAARSTAPSATVPQPAACRWTFRQPSGVSGNRSS